MNICTTFELLHIYILVFVETIRRHFDIMKSIYRKVYAHVTEQRIKMVGGSIGIRLFQLLQLREIIKVLDLGIP